MLKQLIFLAFSLLPLYASAQAKDQILLKFTAAGKKDFIEQKILTSENFKGNNVIVFEENSIDIMNIEVQRKHIPLKCYEGDPKVVEKILTKMVTNSEEKHSRPIAEKKVNHYGKVLMATVTERPEGCGAGVSTCWNMAITVEPCKKKK